MKTKYLVPLDGSELGEHAIPWAKLLGQRFNRQVELLRCHDPMATVYLVPEFAAPAAAYMDSELFHQEIDEYLQAQVQKFEQDKASALRREGDPASVILDLSESGDVAAVIMASHGRGGLGRWLLGSAATKVVRGSRIPVMVINASTEVPPVPKVERILVPLDGSDTSEAALPHALDLARNFGATLLLYHAVAQPRITSPHSKAAIELELKKSKEYLEAFKASYADVDIETKTQTAGSDLGIAEEAADCDLVVMSSHGGSGVKRWLLGSVTEKLLQALDKPLLVVYKREES